MFFTELNEENFLLFAIKNYENPQAVTKEDFEKDLNHFKYIKRLLKRYKNNGELRSHLLINHFIVLYNIFGEQLHLVFFINLRIISGLSLRHSLSFLIDFLNILTHTSMKLKWMNNV